jgi:hypothetical protein
MKYSHIEARTNVNIPTHLGKPVITKYEPDNPLHDPTTTNMGLSCGYIRISYCSQNHPHFE